MTAASGPSARYRNQPATGAWRSGPTVPHPTGAGVADLHEAYFAFRDTLDESGSGLIEGIFDGVVSGQPPIPPSSFPHRDLGDPDGSTFSTTAAALLQLFAGRGGAEG